MGVVDAVAGDGVIDRLGDWDTLEDSGHDHSNAEHSNAGQDEDATPSEPSDTVEDSMKKQQDGGLGEVDAELVGDLAQVEVLNEGRKEGRIGMLVVWALVLRGVHILS